MPPDNDNAKTAKQVMNEAPAENPWYEPLLPFMAPESEEGARRKATELVMLGRLGVDRKSALLMVYGRTLMTADELSAFR